VTTIPDLVEHVVDAMARLAATAEPVQEEWTYVHDLEIVWAARLRAVAEGGAGPAAEPELEAAVDRLIDETSLVADPHRAIDWLSTLPQAVLVALDESAW
jgi:hypothetical protein